MKKSVLSLLVALTLTFGAQEDYSSELSLTVGGVVPSNELELRDYLNLGLRYGAYLDNKYIDIIEFGYERGIDVKYENSTQKSYVNRLFVNTIKEYDMNNDFALYGLAGIGYQDFSNELDDNKDDGFVHIGVGAKWWVDDNFALKAEVREEIDFHSDTNFIYSLGFTIPLGKKVTKEMPIKSEPIVVQEEIKPVVKVELKPVTIKEDSRDDDKDGVINANDDCPTTPLGKVVDKKGCMKVLRLRVNFAYDKSDVSGEYIPRIQEIASFMKKNHDYVVIVDGHTDSIGSKKYNLALSIKRANSVANEFKKYGVDKSKIIVNGHGETNPIATNKTDIGRALNRRVNTSFSK